MTSHSFGGASVPDQKQPDPATLAFLALGLIWGCNFLWIKLASNTITPAQITLLRVLFGFVPVLAYATIRRQLRREHLRYWYHFCVMSVFATSAYYYAFALGTTLLPSGLAGALSGSIPLFSFLGAALFLKSEQVTLARFLAIVAGFGGVLLIARPWDAANAVNPIGVVAMLLGSASVGLSFVYARRFLARLDIPGGAMTTYQMGLALLTLAVVTDWRGITDIVTDPGALAALVLGLGLFGTGIAFLLYYFIVDRLGAVVASSSTYLPPVVALAIGALLINEPITLLDGVGVALILAGVILLRPARN